MRVGEIGRILITSHLQPPLVPAQISLQLLPLQLLEVIVVLRENYLDEPNSLKLIIISNLTIDLKSKKYLQSYNAKSVKKISLHCEFSQNVFGNSSKHLSLSLSHKCRPQWRFSMSSSKCLFSNDSSTVLKWRYDGTQMMVHKTRHFSDFKHSSAF